ncbi:MAG: transglycosylase domain-containing protein [Lachnospiraceae bacterium]|nr:transglycosylase domain-containing protein [Lachnospiraceae bacterium]
MNYGKRGVVKKQKALTSKSTKLKKMCCISALKLILLGLLSVFIIVGSLGLGAFKGIISSAPDSSTVQVIPTGYATVIYDAEGNEMTKLVAADSNRSWVKMSQIPQDLADAFVAIEDERFYEHNGIDLKSIMRAASIAISNMELSQGGSTITQQLIKNNVFENWTNETTMQKIKRKIQEQYLAIELEKTMDKETILEIYMNSINLGQGTLGVQAASMRYFNKPVYQLTLSECAVIAGITKNPSKLNPISYPEKNAGRREDVLDKMLELGYITQAEYDDALTDDVYSRIQAVNQETNANTVYTYFEDALIEQVQDDLIEKLGYSEKQAYNMVFSGGLSIFSTQDPAIQEICDEVFTNEENYPEGTEWLLDYALTIEKADGTKENHSKEMYRTYYRKTDASFNLLYDSKEEAYEAIEAYKAAIMAEGDKVDGERISLTPQPQVSLTIQDQSTGNIVAMIGGRGTKEASRTLNRATDSTRQPGSLFKILATYAPALDTAGLTLASVQNDAEYNYVDGRPVSNWWDTGYRGLLSFRYGIAQSANIVAVKTLTQITPQLGFDYLLNFGFTTLVDRRVESNGTVVTDIGQALALGGITDGVTNLELNAAYATIANNGYYIEPKLYTKIVDIDGNVLIDNTASYEVPVIKETTAWLLTDAMTSVVTNGGTGTSVNFGNMALAGKTGTTSDYKDVWFSGYTPYYTATTWAGYDNNIVLSSKAEKALAKTLWKEVMAKIHENLPYRSFQMPSGIVTATVCSKSGKLPISGVCDGTLTTEYFAEGTVPTDTCDVHYTTNLCAYTGLVATELCPFKMSSVTEKLPKRLAETTVLESIAELYLIDEEDYYNSYSGTTTEEVLDLDGDGIPDEQPVQETTTTDIIQMCPHNELFFSAPNASQVIQQQQQELLQKQYELFGYH